jgi:isoleucyl-tRNA synthetase
MNFKQEADIVRALGEIAKAGHIEPGLKPVNWCMDCGSALAEAEVEYEDKKSDAIDVGFGVVDLADLSAKGVVLTSNRYRDLDNDTLDITCQPSGCLTC